jgi:RNA polymerase sigma-70 factor (ECF subfamily)
MDEFTERNLIEAAKSGDMAAFDVLVMAHQASVRAFFRTRIFDWSAADDLAQDVFLTAFKRIATFRAESRFGTWMRGIAVNHLRNWLRQRRDDPVGGGEELQALFSAQIDLNHYCEQPDGRVAEEAVMLSALAICLGKLDGPTRLVLDERYSMGKTVREISAATSRGYSGVVMQLLRIRKILAGCIRQQLEKAL